MAGDRVTAYMMMEAQTMNADFDAERARIYKRVFGVKPRARLTKAQQKGLQHGCGGRCAEGR